MSSSESQLPSTRYDVESKNGRTSLTKVTQSANRAVTITHLFWLDDEDAAKIAVAILDAQESPELPANLRVDYTGIEPIL